MPTLIYRKGGRPNAHVFGAHDAPIIIGRGLDCAIVVTDGGVSRKHAEIFTLDNGVTWYVRDLQSANGCFVNGQRVEKSRLVDGDALSCGTLNFEFRRGPDTSHIVMTRKSAFYRKERVTPVRSTGVVGDSFRVHESTPAPERVTGPQYISPDVRDALQSAAYTHRIRELDQKYRAIASENLRLRAALNTLVTLTGTHSGGEAKSASADVETFREHIIRSVRMLDSAEIAAVAQVIRAEHELGGVLSQGLAIRVVERERETSEDED